jgi:hypothetical protein
VCEPDFPVFCGFMAGRAFFGFEQALYSHWTAKRFILIAVSMVSSYLLALITGMAPES